MTDTCVHTYLHCENRAPIQSLALLCSKTELHVTNDTDPRVATEIDGEIQTFMHGVTLFPSASATAFTRAATRYTG